MAHDEYDEFPPLTPAAQAVLEAGSSALGRFHVTCTRDRRYSAAVIRETVRQAKEAHSPGYTDSHVFDKDLLAIADNLHSLPPPPPTREELNEALANVLNHIDYQDGSWVANQVSVLRSGIAHYCKEQP